MLSFISTIMSALCVLCMLAIPVLLIIFFIRWIMKKKKKWIGFLVLMCSIGIIITALIGSQVDLYGMTPEERATYYEKIEEEEKQREAEKAAKKKAEEKKEKKDNSSKDTLESKAETSSPPSMENKTESEVKTEASLAITLTDKDIMIMQFESLGLTNAEAIEIASVFENVGITKIWDISKVLGSGIDGEQLYVCSFYDFNPNVDCIKLSFNIVKRKIQRISICFYPYGKLGEYPTTHKYKELNLLAGIKEDTHSDSVTLYYQKLKNYAVDENSVGYRAIYNYETHSISKYN